MTRQYYVYLMTNQNHSTIYVGITNDLTRRVFEHKHKLIDGFTKKYNIDKLVWFEVTEDVTSAIAREKQIKGSSRAKKIELINRMNPNLDDLSERLL